MCVCCVSQDAKWGSEPSKTWSYQHCPSAGRAIPPSSQGQLLRTPYTPLFHLLNLQVLAAQPDLYFLSLPRCCWATDYSPHRLVQTPCPLPGWAGASLCSRRSAHELWCWDLHTAVTIDQCRAAKKASLFSFSAFSGVFETNFFLL